MFNLDYLFVTPEIGELWLLTITNRYQSTRADRHVHMMSIDVWMIDDDGTMMLYVRYNKVGIVVNIDPTMIYQHTPDD